MDMTFIFLTQLITSIFVVGLFANWVAGPWLEKFIFRVALMILIAPHVTRHIGLTFLVPAVTGNDIPDTFAMLTAWGDYISAMLALLAIYALKSNWRSAIPLVWIFNLFGTLDLLKALSTSEAIPTLGGTWYIPTFWVPVLLVTHWMIFARLIKRGNKEKLELNSI